MAEEKGKFIGIISDDRGTSKAGKDFRRVTFSIEIGDKYPRNGHFYTNDEKLIQTISNLRSDELISVKFNMDSKLFNGKSYTNLNAWQITI